MRMIRFFRKYAKSVSKSLFLKFFLAYTFASLFMIILIGSYTRFYILENLDGEIEKFEQKKINETLGTINVLFGEMKKLSLNHAINTKCLQFAYAPRSMIAERQAEVKNLQELLANSINSSNYIRNIAVYYEKDGYVLDYSGPMDLSSYYDHDWYDAYDRMAGSTAILDTRKVKNRSDTTGNTFTNNNIITFLTKIPYSKDAREGAIILNVDEKIISDLLKNIAYGNTHAFAFIINKDGMVLASSRDEDIYRNISDLIRVPPGFMGLNAGSFQLTFEGTKMISYFDTSDVNHWKLFYIVSKNRMFEKSAYIKYITVIILAVLLLLMTAASLLFSFKLYDPIKRITSSIKKMLTVNDESLSDVSMIQGGIKMLFENNQSLEKQLTDNKILMREMFLSHLITGRLFNRTEIMNRAQYFNINLNFDCFKAAVIQFSSSVLESIEVQQIEYEKVSLINIADKVFCDLKFAAEYAQDADDQIMILLKLHASGDMNEIEALTEQALEDIKDSAWELMNLSISIGAGRLHHGISGIGVSYKEAAEALHYKFLKGDPSVISYSDFAGDHTDHLHYPVEMEQKMMTLIHLCDYDKTILVLNDMLDNIMDRNKSFQHIEVCLSNITGIIQRCIYELNLNSKDVFGEDDHLNISMDSFKNIQQFKEWISQKFRKMIEYRMDQQKSNTKDLISDVKDYIEQNYTEEISLVSVASYFNYNPSYFCKIFKEKTGVSFWEYVSKIRIEKSKALLSETGKSIEQIAGMVGYNNRFSYIRTFKKHLSITPGEYRAKYSGKHP